jgi:predicted RNase H-like HicB family nuclease
MDNIKSQVEYFRKAPFTVTVEAEEEGHGIYFVARIAGCPGLIMTGDTPEDALAELESVKGEWIETYLKLGNKMPSIDV